VPHQALSVAGQGKVKLRGRRSLSTRGGGGERKESIIRGKGVNSWAWRHSKDWGGGGLGEKVRKIAGAVDSNFYVLRFLCVANWGKKREKKGGKISRSRKNSGKREQPKTRSEILFR